MTTDAEPAMDRLLDQLNNLHSSPHVACQVLGILQDEGYDICQLVACLEADPALAASVLRLVNSSYFGLARNVSSLQQAVAFLGGRSLRLVVLSFGLVQQLVKDTPATVYHDFWRRSLTMAAAGSRLAMHICRIRGDEAYSVGLLADIGVLVLAQVHTKSYSKLYNKVQHTPLLVESERELYGFDHAQLGARLLSRWNLPEPLVEAVAHHHVREPGGEELQLLTRAADLLADALWMPNSPNVADARALLDAEFGLGTDKFITLAVDCKQIIQDTAEMYNVKLSGQIDCLELLAEARRQYMETAIETAMDWDSLEAVAQ